MLLKEIELSIIIPAYNIESYISACIESVLNQDILATEYEIIVINDGSTDNTLSVIKRYDSYENLRIIDQANQGLSEVRNIGVRQAKGKYIWFIDGDDTITPMCLKNILTVCNKKDVDMFGVGPSISFTKTFPANFDISNDVSNIYTGLEWIKSEYGFIGAWAYIIKKDFWIKNNLSFMKGIYYEDTECMSRAFYYAQRICTLNKFSVYNYVQRPNSIINQSFNYKKLDSRIKAASSILKFNRSVAMNDSFKLYYAKIYTDFYITGISEIVRNKVSLGITKKYIRDFKIIGKASITAVSFSQKIYQYILINFPILYVCIRKLL